MLTGTQINQLTRLSQLYSEHNLCYHEKGGHRNVHCSQEKYSDMCVQDDIDNILDSS